MGLDCYFYKVKSKNLFQYRKYNFLVSYFEEYYDEIGNCSSIPVTKDMILELQKRCQSVLDDHSKANELLPVREGFFFGSLEYDEYYFDAVKVVLDDCSTLLEEFDNLEGDESIVFEIWY